MKPKIWLTRALAQAASTRTLFESVGFEVLPVPILAIEPLVESADQQAIRDLILNFDRYDFALFVSQNAVAFGVPWLDQFWPQIPPHCRFLAVGSATQEALSSAGLPVMGDRLIGSAMNSELMLNLPELAEVKGKRIVVFRGQGGRTFLGDSLRSRGARVDYCELYKRQLPETAHGHVASAMQQGDAWLSVHSGEALIHLCALLRGHGEDWLQWPILVPGDRVAELAHKEGFEQVIVAVNATDIAMGAALQEALKNVIAATNNLK